MLSELQQYLNSRVKNYAEGLQLLKVSGKHKAVYDLCAKFQNSFTEDKLNDTLEQIYNTMLTDAPAIIPDTRQIKPPIEGPKADDPERSRGAEANTVIRLMHEKSTLFKETLALRQALKKTHPLLYRGTIDLGSALDAMDSYDRKGRAIPFSIVCVTYNEAMQTGGDILYYPKAQLAVLDKSNRIADHKRAHKITNKNPNHWLNGTRNIRPYDSKEIRKISIWTIIQFNEMEVTLGNIG